MQKKKKRYNSSLKHTHSLSRKPWKTSRDLLILIHEEIRMWSIFALFVNDVQILYYLTGLLVKDTRSDSKQVTSLSSVDPDFNSWINSCGEIFRLFLRLPWKTENKFIFYLACIALE